MERGLEFGGGEGSGLVGGSYLSGGIAVPRRENDVFPRGDCVGVVEYPGRREVGVATGVESAELRLGEEGKATTVADGDRGCNTRGRGAFFLTFKGGGLGNMEVMSLPPGTCS